MSKKCVCEFDPNGGPITVSFRFPSPPEGQIGGSYGCTFKRKNGSTLTASGPISAPESCTIPGSPKGCNGAQLRASTTPDGYGQVDPCKHDFETIISQEPKPVPKVYPCSYCETCQIDFIPKP